jgi:hypothetical protein
MSLWLRVVTYMFPPRLTDSLMKSSNDSTLKICDVYLRFSCIPPDMDQATCSARKIAGKRCRYLDLELICKSSGIVWLIH